MDLDYDKLKFDYDQTSKYIHILADIRFKLLALVPIVTGATVSLLGMSHNPQIVIPISILGILVTAGIIFYDQRNTQIYDALQVRVRSLEVLLKLPPICNLISEQKTRQKLKFGGPFLDRPKRSRKLLGMILMWHDRGLALIYSTVIGAWCYLLTRGILCVFYLNNQIYLVILLGIPFVISLILFLNLEQLDKNRERVASYPDSISDKLNLKN
ncbi:MAG: hypothetical protein GY839_21340 [candidate division Zixibacteria bacterium]|nr:hypothetical protein [candidate division Zixibacteria bacterium]